MLLLATIVAMVAGVARRVLVFKFTASARTVAAAVPKVMVSPKSLPQSTVKFAN